MEKKKKKKQLWSRFKNRAKNWAKNWAKKWAKKQAARKKALAQYFRKFTFGDFLFFFSFILFESVGIWAIVLSFNQHAFDPFYVVAAFAILHYLIIAMFIQKRK